MDTQNKEIKRIYSAQPGGSIGLQPAGVPGCQRQRRHVITLLAELLPQAAGSPLLHAGRLSHPR